jgi:hypothetical protein
MPPPVSRGGVFDSMVKKIRPITWIFTGGVKNIFPVFLKNLDGGQKKRYI